MPPHNGRWVHESGECEVDLARREMRARGVPVAIGARAFRIVETLIQSAGKLVTKDELMQSVWPSTIVEEHTLHVHISAVRKALGPYRAMLKTESGRGYRLTGSWAVRQQHERTVPDGRPATRAPALPAQNNLPAATSDLIGRDHVVRHIQDLVSAYRVVTLTGPGGIGKTRLALDVARLLLPAFDGDVCLVELASVSDAGLVAPAIASALGLHIGGNNITPEALARAIGGRRLLLVIDNCEHVIEAAAKTVETIMRRCPVVSALATSRERMRIDGECIYRVPPLDISDRDVSNAGRNRIQEASAVQLFVARMTPWQADLQYQDDLSAIASICRHLDGIPLAIEFAAARAATLGVEPVLSGLDDRFGLLISGRRTALPKHRTLRATLDWSYQLLSGPERRLLQHLAIFAAAFSLEAASAVARGGEAPPAEIADGIASLVEKSLVTTDTFVTGAQFRLLETTRVYALEKLAESGELQQLGRLHAEYYRRYLETIANVGAIGAVQLADLGNVRAALEWCYGDNGDAEIGIGLAAAAAPGFLAMSLLPECHRWSERAILALDDTTRGGSAEMHLQASFGVSSMQIHGPSDAARAALSRSLAIAEARGDVLNQVALLGMLSMFHVRDGDFKTSLHYAELSRAVDGTVENSAAMALANSILGRALQFVGEHSSSRVELEASFRYWSRLQQTSEVYLGLDHHILVGIGLARNLWLQGDPARATSRVRQTIKDAGRKGHPASLGLALSWAPEVFIWIGDLGGAEEHADWLVSHATSHSLGPYLAVGCGYKAVLAIRRGDAGSGVESLRCCLEQLHAMRYEMLNTAFRISLIEGHVAIGRFGEAMTLVDETIRLIEAKGDLVFMPEALRVKANILLSMRQPRADDAEACLTQSLELSRHQAARAWELRTATDLATLLAARGQPDQAQAILRPVFEQFEVAADTADLKAAERLLATLTI